MWRWENSLTHVGHSFLELRGKIKSIPSPWCCFEDWLQKHTEAQPAYHRKCSVKFNRLNVIKGAEVNVKKNIMKTTLRLLCTVLKDSYSLTRFLSQRSLSKGAPAIHIVPYMYTWWNRCGVVKTCKGRAEWHSWQPGIKAKYRFLFPKMHGSLPTPVYKDVENF